MSGAAVRIIAGQQRLAFRDGRIIAPDASVDLEIRLDAGEVRPGLINGHDHLHRNHYPRLGRPPYANVYAWGADIHAHDAERIAELRDVPRRDALLFGALKNLLGGATTVVHHDRWEPDFERDFPVRVPRIRAVHSLGLEAERLRDGSSGPLCLHVAEGTDTRAAEEVRELQRLGVLDERLIAVHAVGVDAAGARALRAAGAAVVWCPSSNLHLYGRTAPAALLRSTRDVLLGTDALLTGAGTLLDEIRIARSLGSCGDAAILDAVGATAARRLGLPPPRLLPGDPADFVVLRAPLFEATAASVALVVVRGLPRIADTGLSEIFDRLGVAGEVLRHGDFRKVVAAPLASVARDAVDRVPETARIFT